MNIQGPNFQDLPVEIQLQILDKLDINDIENVRGVSMNLKALAEDPELWRTIGKELGLKHRDLKTEPRGAVKKEVDRIKELAIAAGVPKSEQPVTLGNILRLEQEVVKKQFENLKTYNNPPPSVEQLLKEPPTPENLETLKKWLQARDICTVYKRLEEYISADISEIDSKLQTDENWKEIPTLSDEWITNHSEAMKEIQYLELSYLSLTSLDKKIIQNLVNLQKLNLFFNQLSSLDKEIFHNNKNLKNLNLSSNKLCSLDNEIFKNNSQIQKLNLSYNKIKSLNKETLQSLNNLQEISLWGNPFTALDQKMFLDLKKLKFLFLFRDNELSKDTEVVSKLMYRGVTVQ